MVYFVSPPLFLAGLYAAGIVWREEHPRRGMYHPTE